MLSVWRHSDAICAYNWNLWEIYSPRRGRRLYCHMSQKWPKYLYWFKGVKIIWIDWWECCLSGSEAIPVYSICCNVKYREEQMGDPNPFFDLFYLHRPFKRQCYKIFITFCYDKKNSIWAQYEQAETLSRIFFSFREDIREKHVLVLSLTMLKQCQPSQQPSRHRVSVVNDYSDTC